MLSVAGGHTEAATALQLASDEVEKEHIRGKVHNALEMPALRTETIRRSVRPPPCRPPPGGLRVARSGGRVV